MNNIEEAEKLIINGSINSIFAKRIIGIVLQNYNQFRKDEIIDFTYPLGHEKAGQPMDRICLIGQSGTGKTSILELIKAYISDNKANIPNANEENVKVEYQTYDYPARPLLINFPSYSIESLKKLDSEEILEYKSTQNEQNIIDFKETDPKQHWYPIQKNITEYQKEVIKFSTELGNQIKNLKDIHLIKKEIDSYNHKIEEWKKSHKNPLEELDKFLKPIFSKFYLRVKTEPDNYDEIKFIPIESLSFNENKEAVKTAVQTQFLSSGTQQILSRTVPLFALKPKHTIILIDEPENSLYPNIQKEFIDFITQESWNEGEKTCQFFFATHSPTIASSFDPWEIVELQFNADGKVEQKQYYEGERHVDNYKIHPKYLRWDKILTQVFDIESEGDEERQKQLYELAKIQSKIDYNKKNGNKEKLDELLDAFKKLAEKLQWDINSTMP